MFVLRSVGLCALSAASSLAQGTPPDAAPELPRDLGFVEAESGLRYRVVPVPGGKHVAIVAAIRVGAWHDPAGRTGMAHLLNTLVGLTQEARPAHERWTVRTTGPATVCSVTCAAADCAARLEELARFLSGHLPCDDDLFARAQAQVLQRIDDYLHVIPGPLVVETARRTLLAGTPAGKQLFGVPDEVRTITRAELLAYYGARMRPEHTTLAVLGGVDVEAVARACASVFAASGERTPPAPLPVHDSAGDVQRDRAHARVLAPFVTVAIAGPPIHSPDWLPFVIAMGVVHGRCARTFGAYRGREPEALFPFFWYDYRHGDTFALVNRRGESPDGVVNRDIEAVRAELRTLIVRLRSMAPTLAEVRDAAFEAASSLALPPYAGQMPQLAQQSALLMPRAELLAMGDILGLSPTVQEDLGKVSVQQVMQTLARVLADDNSVWFALTPPDR